MADKKKTFFNVLDMIDFSIMEQRALKIVNNCLNTNIYSYLETSGGQSYNLYLNVVHFLTPVLIIYLWQLKTVVFLHWCLICAVPLCSFLIYVKRCPHSKLKKVETLF